MAGARRNKMEFKLGDKIHDKTTDLKGYVASIHYYLTGCTRYGYVTKDKPDSSYWANEGTVLLEKSKDKIELLPFKYKLGDIVRDKITGKKLFVSQQIVYREGYNRYYCRVTNPKQYEEFSNSVSFEEAELEFWKPWYKRLLSGNTEKKVEEVKETVKTINRSPTPNNRSQVK